MAPNKRRSLSEVIGKPQNDASSSETGISHQSAFDSPVAPSEPQQSSRIPASSSKSLDDDKKKALVRPSLYLHPAVNRQLQILRLDLGVSKTHDLLLAAIDMLFAKYGLKSIAELTKEADEEK